MQIVKVGVKAAIALAAGIFLPSGDFLYRMGIGAICYVLLTYYMWYMKQRGGGFSVFLGKGGFTATLLSFGFMIISPLIPLIVLSLIFNSLGLPEAAEGVFSVLLVIVAIGFVILDIGRAFNPEFLKWGNDDVSVEEQ